MMALAEAHKLGNTTPDFTATMESAEKETEQKLQQEHALEQMAYRNGTRNIALTRLGLRHRMVTEGIEYLKGKVFGEIVYEAYWLDEPVKESATEQIAETIEEALSYIEENFAASKVAANKQSVLLKNISIVIEETANKAADRICKECESSDSIYPEFELTDAEEDEMDEKLVDLGKDELVDLIKSKVAQVVQDEKEKGQERADMFREIDQMSADMEEPEAAEEPTEGEGMEESTLVGTSEEPPKYSHILEHVSYTANERYIANLLENGIEVRIFDDPSWGEFKAYISMMCKSIQNALLRGINRANPNSNADKYGHAKYLIEKLEAKLANVPETVPGDVKEFIMAMVGMIYTAVPSDSVIISRLGNPIGAPDLKSSSPVVNMATISWTDLFVNIKTNLSSVKSYCNDQISDGVITQNELNGSDCPVSGRNSLAQLTATAQTRILTRNIGGSLFESMMLGAISTSATTAMESSLTISDEDVENAAMIESLLNYTILEALDTIGIYKFRMSDVNSLRRSFVQSVSEGVSPFQKKKDKKGLKTVRINTRKMKQKKDINGNRATNDKVAEM